MSFALEEFLLLISRLSGLFLSAPILSSRMLPVRIKVLTIFALAAMMTYFVPIDYIQEITTPGYFIAALAVEILIGYTIGFVAFIIFAAIQLAGQVMDMQMGFGITNVVDPQSGMQIPLMGNLIQTIALLLYLAIDGHHYLLTALTQSYKVIPVMGLNLDESVIDLVIQISVYMFIIAVKISAPVIIAILTADIAMGFVARTVPQMNVFIVGLPVKILVGLGALLVMMPVYIWVFKILFTQFFGYLDELIRLLGM
jgi:flagellar biosynthetic protein FliR